MHNLESNYFLLELVHFSFLRELVAIWQWNCTICKCTIWNQIIFCWNWCTFNFCGNWWRYDNGIAQFANAQFGLKLFFCWNWCTFHFCDQIRPMVGICGIDLKINIPVISREEHVEKRVLVFHLLPFDDGSLLCILDNPAVTRAIFLNIGKRKTRKEPYH